MAASQLLMVSFSEEPVLGASSPRGAAAADNDEESDGLTGRARVS